VIVFDVILFNYNWILNYVNENMRDYIESEGEYGADLEEWNIYKDNKYGYLFLDVKDALNWFIDGDVLEINYGTNVELGENIKLKYGVEELNNVKKYNL